MINKNIFELSGDLLRSAKSGFMFLLAIQPLAFGLLFLPLTSTDGVIEVEGAGIQVFERKKKEPAPTEGSTAA